MKVAPVWRIPNFIKVFTFETDASEYGLGEVLMHEGRPMVYYSRMLGQRAQSKSVYEKELMVVCLSILKSKHYLMGRHFIVHSLKYITQQREVASDYQKWVSRLMRFDFEVQYKPGASNRVADALSRKSRRVGKS